jgi:hypothetical protein
VATNQNPRIPIARFTKPERIILRLKHYVDFPLWNFPKEKLRESTYRLTGLTESVFITQRKLV